MTKSDKAYLVYMAARILELHRLLKPTGSLYLHCDPTMSHYLKLMLDAVFGREQFRNEIVWSYQRWTGPPNIFKECTTPFCPLPNLKTINSISYEKHIVQKGRNDTKA